MNSLEFKKRAFMSIVTKKYGFVRVKSGTLPLTLEKCKAGNLINYKIYGNCGKNLIPYPYGSTTKTEKGITFTDNGDGSITINGTNTSSSYATFGMYYNNTKLIDGINPGDVITISMKEKFPVAGIHIQFNGKLSDNTTISAVTISVNRQSRSITIPDDWIGMNMTIYVRAGITIENFTVYPQLEFGEDATEYEPYKTVGDLEPESGKYVLPVTIGGKNTIPYPYYNTTRTTNGITFTDNGDGSVTVNGTATAKSFFYLAAKLTDIDTTKRYVLSGSTPEVCVYISLSLNGAWKKDIRSLGAPVMVDFPSYANIEYNQVGVSMYVLNGTTVENVTIKPQLELGETATEYEQYKKPNTTNIYLSAPLGIGDSAEFKADGLAAIAIRNGTNVLNADSTVKPQLLEAEYYSTVEEE